MEKIFKKDTKGKIRVWWAEIDRQNAAYRTHSGIEDGKIIQSGWTFVAGKNTGKSNETSAEEQVVLDCQSKYEHQLYQGGYRKTREEAVEDKPLFIKPMLAHSYKGKLEFPAFSQPKLDGVRCIASTEGLQSRSGKPLIATPHIEEALEPFFEKYGDVVLDGELYNHDLKDNFDKLISLIRKTKPTWLDLEESAGVVQYHIYDIIMEGGFGNRFYTNEMKTFLRNIPGIRIVDTAYVEDQEFLDELFSKYLEDGYEGQMCRSRDGEYETKRSKHLLKRKEMEDAEFPIAKIHEGIGSWAGYAKSVSIIIDDEGNTQQSGTRGNQEFLKKLLEEKDEYENGKGTATVNFQNRTPSGLLRFPICTKFYKGKRDM